MKKQLISIIALLGTQFCPTTVLAQTSGELCQVTGRLYRPNGTPAAETTVTVVKFEQEGRELDPDTAGTPYTVQTDATGFLTFTAPRASFAWLQATGLYELDTFGGVPIWIPDAPTAALEDLWHIRDGVTSLNGRDGDVSLTASDVVGSLGFTPANARITSGLQLGSSTSDPAFSIETSGHIRLGVEKAVQFDSRGTPFSIHVGSSVFNGVRDDVFYLGYNVTAGTTTQRINLSEPQLKFGIEANYNAGDHNQMEWNFDYLSADGAILRRPLAFSIDRASHEALWTFAQRSFFLADDNGLPYAEFNSIDGLKMWKNGLTLHGFRIDRRTERAGDNPSPIFRPTVPNRALELGVMPNGLPPTATRAALSIWNTDYRSDQINYERFMIYARPNNYLFYSEGSGTGLARDIIFQDNALTVNARSNRIGIGTSTSNSTLQVRGSFARNVTRLTSSYRIGDSDSIVFADAANARVTLTLPDATQMSGRQYTIKKIDQSSRAVTIETTAGQTIDGTTTRQLIQPYQIIEVVSDGRNWFVL